MAEEDQAAFVRELGVRIAIIRRDRGLTQEQLAELVGVDPQTIQRAETGRTSLSVLRLRRVADAMHVSLRDLFDDEGGPLPPVDAEQRDPRLVALWKRLPPGRRDLAVRIMRELCVKDRSEPGS